MVPHLWGPASKSVSPIVPVSWQIHLRGPAAGVGWPKIPAITLLTCSFVLKATFKATSEACFLLKLSEDMLVFEVGFFSTFFGQHLHESPIADLRHHFRMHCLHLLSPLHRSQTSLLALSASHLLTGSCSQPVLPALFLEALGFTANKKNCPPGSSAISLKKRGHHQALLPPIYLHNPLWSFLLWPRNWTFSV